MNLVPHPEVKMKADFLWAKVSAQFYLNDGYCRSTKSERRKSVHKSI